MSFQCHVPDAWPRSRGRERVRFIQSWALAKICTLAGRLLKSDASHLFCRQQGCGGENDWKTSRAAATASDSDTPANASLARRGKHRGMLREGHSWRSLAEMVTSFPTKICMVEHVSNSHITNYYTHNHLSSPAPISVQRILVLSFAVTPGPAVRAASLPHEHPSHPSPSVSPSSLCHPR